MSEFIGEGRERCGIKVNYVNIYIYFFFYEVLTHVRLHPINTIKPRKKTVNHPFRYF